MSSPGPYNENLTSDQNLPINSRRGNPFTFDSQEEENSYLHHKIIKVIDEDSYSSEESEDTNPVSPFLDKIIGNIIERTA